MPGNHMPAYKLVDFSDFSPGAGSSPMLERDDMVPCRLATLASLLVSINMMVTQYDGHTMSWSRNIIVG